MGQAIYLTDPVVAAAYYVSPGEWASVPDDAEAAWLVATHQGYAIDAARVPPAAGYVHPQAPQPFVPFAPEAGPSPPPQTGAEPAGVDPEGVDPEPALARRARGTR